MTTARPACPRHRWPRGARRLGAPSVGATCGRPSFAGEPPGDAPARRAPPFLPKEMGGKKGQGLRPLDPPKRGLMAAVGCTDRAKTNRALPPVFPAIILQALPRPGRHASGLPCKPRWPLRCTGSARRAAGGLERMRRPVPTAAVEFFALVTVTFWRTVPAGPPRGGSRRSSGGAAPRPARWPARRPGRCPPARPRRRARRSCRRYTRS